MNSGVKSFLGRVVKLFALLVVFLYVALMAETFFQPVSHLANILRVNNLKSELPLAIERWEERKVSSYDLDVNVKIPFCPFKGTLNVRNGKLKIGNEQKVLPPEYSAFCNESDLQYGKFLITEMYQLVKNDLSRINIYEDELIVEFEPTFGFVTFYRLACLNTMMGDCAREYRFSNFRPVLDTTP